MAALLGLLLAVAHAQDAEGDPSRLRDAVSRDRGRSGGVLVLAPRVIPATGDVEVLAAAAALRDRARELVSRAVPLAKVDLAEEPGRVCPKKGCRATSLGVLLAHEGGGCAAVALIGRPGPTPIELVPLAGAVELSANAVPFRAPPESVVTVREFVPCSKLAGALDDAQAVLALRKAVSAP